MRQLMPLTLAVIMIGSTITHADDHMLFISSFAAGEKGAIHSCSFNLDTGELKLLRQTTDIENPFFLAVSPEGRFLYAIDAAQFGDDENEFVTAFRINRKSGQLTRLNCQSAMGRTSCYLDIDDTGKTLVVANYSSGDVAALPIQKDGSLSEAASFIRHTGSSVDPARQKGPFAHSIEISPDNRFALAADLGIDKVLIYRLDPATAKLTPNDVQPSANVAPGSGPRHLTFHPNGRRVYVISELKNTVTVFDYDTEAGTLKERQTISTLPADFAGTSYCADLKMTPDGRFLYGTNRGHDSIAVYRTAEDGQLTLVSIQSSLGKGPQNLLITPDGRWLLCANMPGNNVAVFGINAESGQLTAQGDPIAVAMPSCIRWLP
ncbi:beta-propeller fold lactonase family protein [bacterium]|nr:beta-propeller fold lactonase family protein [bacterium]